MPQELLTVVTRKGQITVPASIRRALKIEQGDKLALSIRTDASGEVTIRAVRSVAEATYGVAGSGGQPTDIAGWREQFEEGMAEEAMAGLSPSQHQP